MTNFFNSQLYFVFLTVGVYCLFSFIYQKVKNPLLNPLLLTSVFLIIYLLIANSIYSQSSDNYNNALTIVKAMLSPLTVCLALPIYTRRHIVKQYAIPILVGRVIGCTTSLLSVYLLGKVFGLNKEMIVSLLPKSVTTAIASEVSKNLGGNVSIKICVVIITGIFGALFGPILCKIFKIDDAASMGMSFGASSHAVGTSKAVEISTRAGAISSVAIVTSGLLTVLIALFL